MAPKGVNVTTDHMEFKNLQKERFCLQSPTLSEVPSICLGRYAVDKIASSLLAYVLLLNCLFMGKINVACNLQLFFILLMTASYKIPCI